MKRSDLANLLGISRGMLSRLESRGMPVSSLEGATTWRQKNLDPARRKDNRPQPQPRAQRDSASHAATLNRRDDDSAAAAFVSAAIFATRHGLARFGAVLPHLAGTLSGAELADAWADPDMPPEVAARWAALCDEWADLSDLFAQQGGAGDGA